MLRFLLSLFQRPPKPRLLPAITNWLSASTLSALPYKFELSPKKTVVTIKNTSGYTGFYTVHELSVYADSPYPPEPSRKMFRAALDFARKNGAAI